MPERQYFQMTVQETLDALGTTPKGLPRAEAEKRAREFGPNELTARDQDAEVAPLPVAVQGPSGSHPHHRRRHLLHDRQHARRGRNDRHRGGQRHHRLRAGIQGRADSRQPEEPDQLARQGHGGRRAVGGVPGEARARRHRPRGGRRPHPGGHEDRRVVRPPDERLLPDGRVDSAGQGHERDRGGRGHRRPGQHGVRRDHGGIRNRHRASWSLPA